MLIGAAGSTLLFGEKYIQDTINPKNIPRTLIRGTRFELYFIFALIFLTVLSFLYCQYLDRYRGKPSEYFMLLVGFVFPIVGILATLITHKVFFSDLWNPIIFIPYVFSASVLVFQYQTLTVKSYGHSRIKLMIFLFFALYVFLSCLEWRFFNIIDISKISDHLLSSYAKPSLVFGSLALVLSGFLITSEPPKIVQIISQESLGIYLLHTYVLDFMASSQGYWLGGGGILPSPLNLVPPIFIPIVFSRFLKRMALGRLLFA
jgi:surface polysaccharide O-acyltransferase-like enzyme